MCRDCMHFQIEKLTRERDEYKQVFEDALSHVDNVFQVCHEIPSPILPHYSRLGENKFAAVERLARDYLECRKLLREACEWMGDVRTNDDGVIRWAEAARAAGGE